MGQHHEHIDPAILAEQKAYKASKESFREAIKTLADEQRDLKPQRKQNSPDGGVITPAMAVKTHLLNRKELRHLNIAYALFRGKAMPEQHWTLTEDRKLERTALGNAKAKEHPRAAQDLADSKPNLTLIEKLLSKHVKKSTVPYPTETEAVRDSPDGHSGC